MGHYHHIRYTFIFKDLHKDIVEMVDMQEKWHYHDNFYKQTEEDITRRRKECYALSDKIAAKHDKKSIIGVFIQRYPTRWDGFLLYETDTFEWTQSGVEYPSGFEQDGYSYLHGQMDLKNAQTFRDFIDLVKPYIQSGSAWGWWESDMSAVEVFY